MKPLKHKRTTAEQTRENEKRSNYNKFLKSTVKERRKQININK